jgi:hypothetical protein
MLLILAVSLVIAGLVTDGLVSALLLYLGALAVCSAATRALPYGAGLAEHHQ